MCPEQGRTSADKTLLFLGLLLLRYSEDRIIEIEANASRTGPGLNDQQVKDEVTSRGFIYLPPKARFSRLLSLPSKIGKALNEAARVLESYSPRLKGVIPRTYHRQDTFALISWMEAVASAPIVDDNSFLELYLHLMNRLDTNDYEYTREYFTPRPVIEMITWLLKHPLEQLYDPECGTGSFLQTCAALETAAPSRVVATANSQIMKGLASALCTIGPVLPFGELFKAVRQGDSIYEPIREHFGTVDTIICNPPFNMRDVDKRRIYDARFPFGLPRANNSNYIFIQIIYSALPPGGRACFLMADAASDAGGSEREIRGKLIETGVVDTVISLGVDTFGKARVPSALWFFDKGKPRTPRHDHILFVDAQRLNRVEGKSDRPLTGAQLRFLHRLIQLYRGERPESMEDDAIMKKYFPEGRYRDVDSLCRVVNISEIGKHGWSANPRVYLRGDATQASHAYLADPLFENARTMEAELEKLDVRARELEHLLQAHKGLAGGGEPREQIRAAGTKSAAAPPDIRAELILVNVRRCAIFESQALRLYRDWFIARKFPGHEKCEMVESACGVVPAGWHTALVGDLADLFVGNKAEENKNCDRVVMINQRCIRDAVVDLYWARTYPARITTNRRLRVGDILINVVGVGTMGRVAQVIGALHGYAVDSHICVVRPHETHAANYLGLTLLSLQNYFAELGTGTTGNRRLRKDTIAQTAICLPPEQILAEFNREVSCLRDRAIPLLKQNTALLQNCELER